MIASVEVKIMPGSSDEARLRGYVSVRSGEAHHSEKVDGDIKALYQSGLIDDARVLAYPDDGKLKLTYEVTPSAQDVEAALVGKNVFKVDIQLVDNGVSADEETFRRLLSMKPGQAYRFGDFSRDLDHLRSSGLVKKFGTQFEQKGDEIGFTFKITPAAP